MHEMIEIDLRPDSAGRYMFCNEDSAIRSVPIYHLERAVGGTSLREGKKLSADEDLDHAADEITETNLSEFCWSLCFHPSFLVRLLYSV